MHSESAREQLHAKWLPSGTNSLPSGLCQLSQVLKDARVIMCGQWKPLATSRAGPSQSRCSLGAGVLCQIMCRLNPEYIIIKIKIKKQTKKSGLCQLSQVLKGARVIICGQWKPLATSRAGPSQRKCSLGVGVLCKILCRVNPTAQLRAGLVLVLACSAKSCAN